MEYYSAIKRNEIDLFVVRWMDLETVIQTEVSQKEKNKYRMLTHIYRQRYYYTDIHCLFCGSTGKVIL